MFVSAASAWEIATKHRIGKLPQAAALAVDIPGILTHQGFMDLPITVGHGQAAGSLPGPHRDPFDRMLIAQARSESATIVTHDRQFEKYDVRVLWN